MHLQFFVFLVESETVKTTLFKFLAQLNKALWPSYTKKRLDLAKASKLQLAIIGWRYFVTTRAVHQ